jgi:hypothetical protein
VQALELQPWRANRSHFRQAIAATRACLQMGQGFVACARSCKLAQAKTIKRIV